MPRYYIPTALHSPIGITARDSNLFPMFFIRPVDEISRDIEAKQFQFCNGCRSTSVIGVIACVLGGNSEKVSSNVSGTIYRRSLYGLNFISLCLYVCVFKKENNKFGSRHNILWI